MTQDEVDLIYDYLHEYYRYKNGNLIRVKKCGNRKVGEMLGSVNLSNRKGRLRIQCNIYVNNKTYSMQLHHLIYIYHNKTKEKYLRFKDQNPMNTKIENIESCTLSQTHHPNNYNKPKKGYKQINIFGQIRFRPTYQPRGKNLVLDSYETKEEAIEAYIYAKTLYCQENISIDEIYQKVHNKFPGLEPKRRPHSLLPKGVYQSNKKFYAKLYSKGKSIRIGLYSCPNAAHEAYLKAKMELANK